MAADVISSMWVFLIDLEFSYYICLKKIIIKGILYQKMKSLSYSKCKTSEKYFRALKIPSDIYTGKS